MELTDPCRYAFACLNAQLLRDLYPEPEENEYRQNFLEDLFQYLSLKPETRTVVSLLLDEGGHNLQPYIDLLLSEPIFCGDGSIVVYNALQFAVHKGSYDSRTRCLIQCMASLLRIQPEQFEMLEANIVHCIEKSQKEEETCEVPANDGTEKRDKFRKIKRAALIGVAGVGGGVVVGITGGLAAPLIGVGLGAIIGGSAVAAAFSTVAGVAVVGTLFGAAGAGLAGHKMNRRIGKLEEFWFRQLPEGEGSKLHVTIAVSSWLLPEPDRNNPERLVERLSEQWETLAHSQEQYLLIYETSFLLELGQVLGIAIPQLATALMSNVSVNLLGGLLLKAISLPRRFMRLTSLIDNPWGTCNRRCVQVGQQLADVLLKRIHGNRPITLVGYNLGARVIYYCLREMHRKGNYKGIIQDAIIIGAPVTAKPENWQRLVQVVGGRLVNAFCRTDVVLKFLYRASSASVEIAGLQPIDIDHRRMHNLDLTQVVNGHLDYQKKFDDIIKAALLTTAASCLPSD